MKHDLQYKDFQIESFKADESGKDLIIEGWGAYFDNVDSYGDVIKKGAFTKTLMERKDRIAFAYQHDVWNPIGKIMEIEERDKGLFLRVKLSAAEKDIQTKVKEGILKEMSIGYRTINSAPAVIDGQDINTLTEVMLYEVSLVTIAANPKALITSMKGEEKRDFLDEEFERLIAIERNQQKKYDLMKLKSYVITALNQAEPVLDTTPKQDEPQETLTQSEILKLLQ